MFFKNEGRHKKAVFIKIHNLLILKMAAKPVNSCQTRKLSNTWQPHSALVGQAAKTPFWAVYGLKRAFPPNLRWVFQTDCFVLVGVLFLALRRCRDCRSRQNAQRKRNSVGTLGHWTSFQYSSLFIEFLNCVLKSLIRFENGSLTMELGLFAIIGIKLWYSDFGNKSRISAINRGFRQGIDISPGNQN